MSNKKNHTWTFLFHETAEKLHARPILIKTIQTACCKPATGSGRESAKAEMAWVKAGEKGHWELNKGRRCGDGKVVMW